MVKEAIGRCMVSALIVTAMAFAWVQTSEARVKHIFEIGPELSYVQYKEPDVMDEKGPSIGVSGSYTQRRHHGPHCRRFSYSR